MTHASHTRQLVRAVILGLGLAVAGLVTPTGADDPTTWSYHEKQDPMGRGTIKYATVVSPNPVTFKFPYGGPQFAVLQLRIHPTQGKDIILILDRAHFLCHTYDNSCRATVRVDEGKPQTFRALPPADHSTDILFIEGYESLVPQLKQAKTLRVEAMFYQEGRRVFEFNVAGLTWDTPVTGKPKPKAKSAVGKTSTRPPPQTGRIMRYKDQDGVVWFTEAPK